MADPRAWWAAVRSGREWLTHHSDPNGVGVGEYDGTTHLGLPAVFLIGPDVTLVAAASVDGLLKIDRSLGN
jgi:hypothetical protein